MTTKHAPAAAERLARAEATLRDLENQLGPLALESSEGDTVAGKKLAALETQIAAARREVEKLQRAHRHAVQVDAQAVASAVAKMRGEQVAAFEAAMAARERAMTTLLDSAAAMATAFATYAQASLDAQAAVPHGTALPMMNMGHLGTLGSAFGAGESLIAAELFRVATPRKDGRGRWVMPIARAPSQFQQDHRKLAPAADEFRAANAAILRSVMDQCQALNERDMAAAGSNQEAA